MNRQGALQDFFDKPSIIPVIVIERIEHAVPLARALVAGGLDILEVTLRTDCALDAIQAIAESCPEAKLAAGTVRTGKDLESAKKAGARFAVSPGATHALLEAADVLPLLPGAASPSESMALLEAGFSFQKFFPAEASGGRPYLSSVASPLPQVKFCPTGGISAQTAVSYLSLPNVFAIGGSWMAPVKLMQAGSWDEIRSLAADCTALTQTL